MRNGIPWSEGDTKILHRLWRDEVLTAAEIGRVIGRSKRSVIGKAFRLGLPEHQMLPFQRRYFALAREARA